TVTQSIVSNNTAGTAGGDINNGGSTATISNTLIINNQAPTGGGLGNDDEDVYSTLYLYNSTVQSNTATTGDGGGLANLNTGSVYLTNSTLSGNSANNGSGGGIYNEDWLKMLNSTMSGNSAATGGGLGFPPWWSSPWNSIQNSIFTNHTGGDCGNLTVSNATLTGSNNLIDSTTCDKGAFATSGAVINFDTTLRDNGGPTPTHALLPGSNAIDAGTGSCPDMLGSALTEDQRGFIRPVDYDGVGGAVCDIGAFEAGLDETSSATLITGQSHTFGPTRVTITQNSGDAGTVTVSRHSQPPGGGAPDSGEMPFHWRITVTGTTYNLDLTLCYTDQDLNNGNGVVEANLQMFRNTGGPTWTAVGGTVDTVNNCVTLTGVTALSSWTLGSGSPTAVSLQQVSVGTAVSPMLWLLLLGLLGITGLLLLHRHRQA
ncbi:MAG: choice-of-anchor Q domain-containing protein, partial [Anaerolineae bacterium]